ncbi:MAG: WD40 repeat domain-containing serine/threonine-protein kinase [Anaerotignum sp.]|nr:WD40 repeat domain-containing serine/threonine-protein kinase [Anaerotignum sp.]
MSKDKKTILDADETISDSDATVSDSDATVYDSDETVSDSDAIVYDSDETAVEAEEATLSDDGATMSDDATVLDGEEVPVSGSDPPIFEKGASLLDTYRIEADAIKGGMGAVWRVHHFGWNVDLAMKRPKEGLFRTEKEKENFIRECKAWINLGLHPHIVSCYYVRRIGDVPTIFSEWMDGGSLKNAIRDGRLYEGNAAERILDIAIQSARGLHYAHEQGLIHQDVKPDNLLLTKDWEAKVGDFGIARARATLSVLDGDIPADVSMYPASGDYTFAYCSVEQRSRKPLTLRTDIYSWAVTVMEMYLGERLWESGVIAGAACEVYFPKTRVPIPKKMQQLLRECLKTEEAERPHDFAVVETALRSIYKKETGNAYARKQPKAARDTASSLNNRGLSFLDLGKLEEAQKLLKQAVKADRSCEEAVYNWNLLQWREGKQDDCDTIAKIEALYENNETAQNACRIVELCLLSQEKKLAERWINIAEKKRDADPAIIGQLRQRAQALPAAFGYAKGESGLHKMECVSHSGRLSLEGNHSGVRIWNTLEEKLQWDLPIRFHWKCAAFSYDENYLYLGEGSNVGTVYRCDLRSGYVEALLESPYVKQIELHPNGKHMLTAGEGEPIRLWDAQSGQKIKTYRSTALPAKCLSCVCPLPGWKRFLAGGSHFCLVDLETGEEIYSRKPAKTGEFGIRDIYLDADGDIALTDECHTIRYWDVKKGYCLKTCEPQSLPPISTLQAHFVSAREGVFWYIPQFKAIPGFLLCKVTSVHVRLSVEKQMELAKKKIQLLLKQGDMAEARRLIAEVFSLPEFSATQAWSDLNVKVGMGCAITGIYGVQPVKTYRQSWNEPICAGVTCSADGSYVALGVRYIEHATAGYDYDTNALLFFQSSRSLGKPQGLYNEADTGWPRDNAAFFYPYFCPDGRHLLLDNRKKKTLLLFDAISQEHKKLAFYFPVLGCFADGEMFLSGKTELSCVSLSTGERSFVYKTRPDAKLVHACVSAAGRHVFCAYEDGGIQIFHASDGQLLREAAFPVEVCHKGVSAVIPCGDESYVLCGGDDGRIRICSIESGEVETVLEGHHGGIASLALSKMGNDLYSSTTDGTMIRWQVDWKYAE